jgi:hypothetical protein
MSLETTYFTCGHAGDAKPGAPTLHYHLVVDESAHIVAGFATITQALAPPHGVRLIPDVTGKIYSTGLPPVTKVVSLRGTCVDGAPFAAHLAIDNSWKGRGGFSCGQTEVEDVPVQPDEGRLV